MAQSGIAMSAGHPSAQAGVKKGEFKAMLSYTVSMKKQKLEQSTAEHTCVTQWLRQGIKSLRPGCSLATAPPASTCSLRL